jgi:hypothetical protein
MGSDVKRKSKGTPDGGQFAPNVNAESTVTFDRDFRVEPHFGKLYGGSEPFVTMDGTDVFLYRKGQTVRFFDAAGNQVGPEQSNVAPAVAYANSQGWRKEQPKPVTTVLPASELKPGQLVLIRDVTCETLSEMVRDGHTDQFGQKLNVVQFRRLDTGDEGPMYFGPAGVVHLLSQPQASSVTIDESRCAECGSDMSVDENEVSRHLDADGEIDYDRDDDHVAFLEMEN